MFAIFDLGKSYVATTNTFFCVFEDLEVFDFAPSLQKLSYIFVLSPLRKAFEVHYDLTVSIRFVSITFILITFNLTDANNRFCLFDSWGKLQIWVLEYVRIVSCNSFFQVRLDSESIKILVFGLFLERSYTDEMSELVVAVLIRRHSIECICSCCKMIVRVYRTNQTIYVLRG